MLVATNSRDNKDGKCYNVQNTQRRPKSVLKSKHTLLLLAAMSFLLAGCGGGGESAPAGGDFAGDPARGELLYQQPVIGSKSAPGCVTCHSLESGVTLVGPSMAGIASKAAANIADPNYGGSAGTVEEYLHESIVSPNAFVESGFPPGVMYQNYQRDLTGQEVADLVSFLLELK
jgi:nitric oxide reductase subunit C